MQLSKVFARWGNIRSQIIYSWRLDILYMNLILLRENKKKNSISLAYLEDIDAQLWLSFLIP